MDTNFAAHTLIQNLTCQRKDDILGDGGYDETYLWGCRLYFWALKGEGEGKERSEHGNSFSICSELQHKPCTNQRNLPLSDVQ